MSTGQRLPDGLRKKYSPKILFHNCPQKQVLPTASKISGPGHSQGAGFWTRWATSMAIPMSFEIRLCYIRVHDSASHVMTNIVNSLND